LRRAHKKTRRRASSARITKRPARSPKPVFRA
jgi:hypothetical protein